MSDISYVPPSKLELMVDEIQSIVGWEGALDDMCDGAVAISWFDVVVYVYDHGLIKWSAKIGNLTASGKTHREDESFGLVMQHVKQLARWQQESCRLTAKEFIVRHKLDGRWDF